MKKIPGTLFQIEITSSKFNKFNLAMWYRSEMVLERTGLIEEEIFYIIQDVFADRALSIPRNRVERIVQEEIKDLSTKHTISFVESTVSEMLDEFEKAPTKEMKKIVLIGLSNAGKTCIYERVFEAKKPWELMHSAATKGISYKEYKVGNVLKPSIWDLGGQQQYLDEYHGPLRKSIFKRASILLYVIDVNDVNSFDKSLKEFEWAANQIISFNPDSKLNVFLHKIDLIHDKEEVINYLKKLLSKNITQEIFCHPTSIFDESLFKAWSEIIRQMSPKSTYVNSILRQMKNQEGVRDVLLIEKSTGLACGSTLDISEEDIYIGMLSLLIVTIDKVTKRMQLADFREFRLKTDDNYVLLTDVTPELMLVIILTTIAFDRKNLKEIELKGKEVTTQIKKLWSD
ncbi:MAG: ADP-ribosylation factor-like protein [Candidatus Odinarchaeota archaeon]